MLQKFTKTYFVLILILLIGSTEQCFAQFGVLDPNAKISVITCTPGDEIYTAFGHSAIRISGLVDSNKVDWVYNYGVFEFSDDFEWKFAQGKLNYKLEREPYHEFQYYYLITERGVIEQILNLNSDQKQKLFNLLEENNLPENRVYLYDFFYNNCSTKVKDMLIQACGDELVFENLTDNSTTFRDRIQEYLHPFEWTDYGIDLALGLPCDKIIEAQEDTFLPDYLFDNIDKAKIGELSLVKDEVDLLIEQDKETESNFWTPANILWITLILVLILSILSYISGKKFKWLNILFYLISGILGIAIFLLWFATDHNATANNLNLLWAFPLNIILPFLKDKSRLKKALLALISLLLIVVLVFGKLLPQDFHPAVIPFSLILLVLSLKNYFAK